MSVEQRTCPYCGMAMAPDQRSCPDCGNPYPFDDEPSTGPPRGGSAPTRTMRSAGTSGAGGGVLGALAPHKTLLTLVGVLVLIIIVGYALFSFGMQFFESGRPDPADSEALTPAPVIVQPTPGASPGVGASPTTGGGTVIAPAASPSPAAPGVRLRIANTEGQGANMRQQPSTDAPVVRTLPEGDVVEAIGGETNAEGRNWRNVRDDGGATGWIASELLAPE